MLLEQNPALRVSNLKDVLGSMSAERRTVIEELFRHAGLPE